MIKPDFVEKNYIGYKWETVKEIVGGPLFGDPEEDEMIMDNIYKTTDLKPDDFMDGFLDSVGWYVRLRKKAK